MAKRKKSAPKKEKKVKVKKKTGPKVLYTLENGKAVRMRYECPRCGPGYFMAAHYDRRTCGNCSFTQFLDKDGNIRGSGGPGMRRRRVRRTRATTRRPATTN